MFVFLLCINHPPIIGTNESNWMGQLERVSSNRFDEFSNFVKAKLLPSEASRLISKAKYSNDAKFHFVNFSSSLEYTRNGNRFPGRRFLMQNTFVRVQKSDNNYVLSMSSVFGLKEYLPNMQAIVSCPYGIQFCIPRAFSFIDGWLRENLTGNEISEIYSSIQSKSQSHLDQALNQIR